MVRLRFAAVFLCVSISAVPAIEMDWVTVGDPGNAPDPRYPQPYRGLVSLGGVGYVYNIGKFEVTNAQYAEFLNAVAAVGDPNGLYNTVMGGGWHDIGGISRTGSGTGPTPWLYAARPNRGNRPVVFVSWYDALRFANWMHNGQGSGDTEDGAYDMSVGTGVVRKPGARVFLPSEDEWYKAAYYKGGGMDAGYWDYPTETDHPSLPKGEAPPGTDLASGSANCYEGAYVDPTHYTTEVGAYYTENPPGVFVSDSAYGTFDQGGNVGEWNEADIDDDGSWRGVSGGSFGYGCADLHAAQDISTLARGEGYGIGFRVAGVSGPGCTNDHDGDGDVDLHDFALWQRDFTGPR